jgi:hypothetical protein
VPLHGCKLRFLLEDANPSEDPVVPIEADHASLLHNILSRREVNTVSRHENEDAMNIRDEMVHTTIMITKVMILVIKHITSHHGGMTLRIRLPSDLIPGTRANIGARLTPVPCRCLLQRVLQWRIHRSTLVLPWTHCLPPLLHPPPPIGAPHPPNTASGRSNTSSEPRTNKPSSSQAHKS